MLARSFHRSTSNFHQFLEPFHFWCRILMKMASLNWFSVLQTASDMDREIRDMKRGTRAKVTNQGGQNSCSRSRHLRSLFGFVFGPIIWQLRPGGRGRDGIQMEPSFNLCRDQVAVPAGTNQVRNWNIKTSLLLWPDGVPLRHFRRSK